MATLREQAEAKASQANVTAFERLRAIQDPWRDIDRFHAEMLAPVAGQIADAASTLYVLRKGGKEANPVMRVLVQKPVAFVAAKVGLGVATGLAVRALIRKGHPKLARIAGWTAAMFGFGPAAYNALVTARRLR